MQLSVWYPGGAYLYCARFMFNQNFLFFFFSVASGQLFHTAPASLVDVPALIYQCMLSLYKGGAGGRGEGKQHGEEQPEG